MVVVQERRNMHDYDTSVSPPSTHVNVIRRGEKGLEKDTYFRCAVVIIESLNAGF